MLVKSYKREGKVSMLKRDPKTKNKTDRMYVDIPSYYIDG